MLRDVEVICFFSCYAFAFLLEALRFRFTQRLIWRVLAFIFLFFGIVVHCVSLCRNDLLQNDHFFSSASGWFYVLAFGLILVQAYLSLFYPKFQFGLFLYPLTFTALTLGLSATNVVFPANATCRIIRTIHAGTLLLATLVSFLGAISGAMFLLQRYRLKRKIFSSKFTLPTLEWLGCATRHSTNVAVLFLGIGVVCGFYLETFVADSSVRVPAREDPVIIGATFLFFVALSSRIYRILVKRQDINANDATLSFICCVALVVLLLFAAFANKGHWRGRYYPESKTEFVSSDDSALPQIGSSVLLRENDDGQ